MDEEPLSSIGLQSVSIMDIGHGAVLGIILYLLYTIPLKLFMNMSVTQYPLPFDEMPFLYKLLFISLFTAITEEVIFRGYIFTKLNQLVRSKWVVILISCILFYAVHLPRILTFSGNQIYESFITTILFCYYLYFFTKKSIIPLMIAHCFYIILRAGYGYIVWNAIFSMF
jgi:membrane protease YdiL (CAAX protease family)